MGYFTRKGNKSLDNWKCKDCHKEDGSIIKEKIISRCCSLPFYKDLVPEKRSLNIVLGNKMFLDTCPISTLNPWALDIWSEYQFQKAFGVRDDLPEITYKAFVVILNELERVQEIRQLEAEVERKRKKLNG